MACPPTQTGKLIVFEGIDGTGKSTQIKALAEFLQSQGQQVVTGYEPTHGTWGKKLRDSMITGRLSHEEEIDLFLKDRRENVEHFILPHLEKGFWVLLDRYYFSMMAYQGARGDCPQELRKKNEEFAPVPSLVLWLDIPVQTALERIGARGDANEFEQAGQLERCRAIFSEINDEWFMQIDASGTPQEVRTRIQELISTRYPLSS